MTDGTDTGQRLRFAFLTPCVGEDFFRTVRQGMQDAAVMLGVECSLDGTEEVDLPLQADMLRRAVADGVDGIAVSVAHPTALNAAIREARDQGVPVVGFNVAAGYPGNGCMSVVCQRLYEAGLSLGQMAAPHIAPGAHVLTTMHSAGVSALEDRLRGIQEALAPQGITWQVVITGMQAEGAATVIGDALRQDASPSAILCTGQADTEGAGLAVERAPAGRGLYVAGFDLSPEILRLVRAGVIAGTIDQQPYLQGFYPVVQLALYCRYGLYPSDIDTGAALITREDADSVLALSAAGYR